MPRKLNQVFLNLLLNAASFIPAGKDGRIEITTHYGAEQAKISIRDNGVGIEDELKKNIFDPFYTTKGAGSGKGLGLSISYKLNRRT